jgi:hypothetical protein
MILTQLEGKVLTENWDVLKQAYRVEMEQKLPSSIHQTYLVQDSADRALWRILTFWKSRQALDEYIASVETPTGRLMFRAAGTEPNLTIFEVADRSQ